MIALNDIMTALTGKTFTGQNLMLTEAAVDSRKVLPGGMFVALRGEHTDGHEYITDAFQNGALIAIVEKPVSEDFRVVDVSIAESMDQQQMPKIPFCIKVKDSLIALQTIARFWRHKVDLRVIAITGSVGKSSTKELVAEVLNQKYRTHKNPGNYNNEIGLPLTILSMGLGHERLITEMGFYYPGEIKFLCEIASPQIGIITNVGTVHAERAGSQAQIAAGKAELAQALPAQPHGIAILNHDDALVREMASMTKAKVLFYGLSPEANVWASDIESKGLHGIALTIHYQKENLRLQVPLLGRHSVQTVLSAAAAGLADGLSFQEIAAGLEQGNGYLRLVPVRTESGALILDDTYNATPESTLAALDLLNGLQGQKIAVLGDMLELGQYEQEGHEQVGKYAARIVNHLIAVGERGKTIAETARASGLSPAAITWVENAVEATELLRYNLKRGDVVLIKGSHGLRMDRIAATLEGIA